jgi:uncharacterized membrane protein (UPF0136 family)
MKRLQAFVAFVYDFVVGDDWRLALAVVIGLALTAFLAHRGVPAWWVLPVFVVVAGTLSLRRARRLATTP